MAWNPFKNKDLDNDKHVGDGNDKALNASTAYRAAYGDKQMVGLRNLRDDEELLEWKISSGKAFDRYIKIKKEGSTITFGLQHKTLEKDIYELLTDPLIKQYGQADARHMLEAKNKFGLDIHYPHTKIWQAIARQRAVVMHELLTLYRTSREKSSRTHVLADGKTINELTDEERDELMITIDRLFYEQISNLDLFIDSEVFKWNDKTFNLAMDMHVPEHDITPEIMPVESMFIVLEKPIYFSDPVDTETDRRFGSWINLKLLTDENSGLPFRIQWSIESNSLLNHRNIVSEGLEHVHHANEDSPIEEQEECRAHSDDRIAHGWIGIHGKYPMILDPEEYEGDPRRIESVKFINDMVIKMLTFINTTVSRVETEPVDRATRKRGKKDGHSYPNVNVINLRAYESNGRSSSNGSGDGDRYIRGHMVKGFNRQQRHGINNSLTKIVYIDPFYRGDLENMIKEPKVYNVQR